MSREHEDMSPVGLERSLGELTEAVRAADGDPDALTEAVIRYSNAEVNCMLVDVIVELATCLRRLHVATAAAELLTAATSAADVDENCLDEAEAVVESDVVSNYVWG
jgi:hypothetical protein